MSESWHSNFSVVRTCCFTRLLCCAFTRKVLSKQQQPTAPIQDHLGGLSIDGVGSSAPDEPPFNARLRAFSKGDLPKQSQDQQLSARDNRP